MPGGIGATLVFGAVPAFVLFLFLLAAVVTASVAVGFYRLQYLKKRG